jgi:glyoxylase-like metal-dependent hydrolase (beta-lactamase superfamily II)
MIKKISLIIPEHWHMDGGVSFGVVPKGIWNKSYPANEDNNLYIVNRLPLVETDNRLILFNTGYGNKRPEKYYQFKYIKKQTPLAECIREAGYHPDDITDVVYTHLHDDHCGGGTYVSDDNGKVMPVFGSARHWISAKQWEWALNPNPREAASYFPDNLLPLQEAGVLNLLQPGEQPFAGDDILLRHYDGHTAGQMIPLIQYRGKTIVYASDFIPSSTHIPLPYIASVDIAPLTSLSEKESFLEEAAEKKFILVFEHDTVSEACTVVKTEKGFFADKKNSLCELLSV